MTGGKVQRAVEFVRGEQHGGSSHGRLADHAVDHIAARLVESGMRLVEQPQPGPTNDHSGERRATALTGGKVTHRHVSESIGNTEPIERSIDRADIDARRPRPEAKVLLDAQVVVERGVVTEQTDRPTNSGAVADEVVVENERTARLDPLKAGAHPKQCRLAGPVRALQQDDLTCTDVEIDSGEGRKPAEQGNDAVEGDDGHRKRLPGHPWGTACQPRSCLQYPLYIVSVLRPVFRRVLAVLAATATTSLTTVACSADDGSNSFDRDPAAAADAALDQAAAAFDASVTGDGTTSTVARQQQPNDTTPPTLPGIVVNEYLLAVNECFDRVERLNQGVAGTVTTRLPCDLPHQAQVFSRIAYPADHPSFYPGDDIMEDYALAACYVYFEPWVDAPYETSALDIGAITPNRSNFEDQGYRYIQCYVERSDGEPLVGDARGSGL